jgi:hypothetical protein
MSAFILATFDLERQIVLKIDALNYVIRICINQYNNKRQLRSVVFYSRKMISAELNYKIYNKKLLAIVIIFNE